jgi:hypothetical protein
VITKQDVKDASNGALALIGAGAVALIVFLIVGTMWIFGAGWFSNATANFRGNVAVHNQINANGSYRIAAYDHFFDLCTQVQTAETSTANDQDELKITTDQQRKLVLVSSITALKNSRADLIHQYNNDSQKSYTEGQFKSSKLPYQLDLTQENTTCIV